MLSETKIYELFGPLTRETMYSSFKAEKMANFVANMYIAKINKCTDRRTGLLDKLLTNFCNYIFK